MSENRHPAGTSLGGQWAPGSAGEVDVDDLPDGQYDVYDERGNAVADEGRKGSTSDAQLDKVLDDVGVYSHRDCPGLAEAWREKYPGATPANEQARQTHLDDARRGSLPPWSVLADPQDLGDAKSERASAMIRLNDSDRTGNTLGALHFDSAESISSILESDDPEGHKADYYSGRNIKYFFNYDSDVLPEGSDAKDVKALRRRELDEKANGIENGPASREASRMRRSASSLTAIRDQRNARIDRAVDSYNEASDEVWSLGWTGAKADMPARPGQMKYEDQHF